MCVCVYCVETSCLVPSDFWPGSRTGQDRQREDKGGEGSKRKSGLRRGSSYPMEGKGGWEEVADEGGEYVRREYVRLGMEEAGLEMKMGTVDVPRVLVLRLGW